MLKSESKTPSELKKSVQINEELTYRDSTSTIERKERMSECKRKKKFEFDPEEAKVPSNYRPCLK